MDALIPGIDPETIGDWKILYRISTSDNSILYYGSRGRAGSEEAAIKVIGQLDTSDSSALERLKVEVDALEKLNNPHIAKLISKDLNANPAWIATEYLGRKSLETQLIQNQSPVEGANWWELARSIFSGLSDMHSVNIIHRDIKPANIMIDGSTIKIIDFGISYVPGHTSARENKSLQFEGSRLFAAPENYDNRFTPTMDVFSAAVTLAYAARLKSIWNDENEDTLSESIRKGSPDLNGLTPEQVELITPLLDKFASQRPSSKEVLDKILEYIEFIANRELPKPIPLRGSSYFYRLIRKKSFRYASILILLFSLTSIVMARDPEIVYVTKPNQETNSEAVPNSNNLESSNKSQSTSAQCEEAYLNNADDVSQKCLSPANAGDTRSMYYLGVYEERNNNIKAAESWFIKAAQKDDASSMEELVQIYIDSKQIEKYNIWVKRCADFPAKVRSVARCKLLYGLDQIENGKITNKGLLYLKDSYEYGNSSAATTLGIHFNSLNDSENALLWWERAAELGDKSGTASLIRLANKLGKKDLVNKWLKTSADNGNAEHAWMYAMEFLDREDYKTAKKYALMGANGGNTNAMGILGVILWKNEKDIKQAKVWLTRAANMNDVYAINLLGDISRLEDKNYEDALSWYKKSEKLGDLQGGYFVGLTYVGAWGNADAACVAFKNVLSQAEKLKKSLRYEKMMEEWVIKSNEAIPEVCT